MIDLDLILPSLLTCLVLLVIQADQIFVGDIETIQMINCVFGTVNVLINHKCSALRFRGVAFADLSDVAILTKDVVEFVSSDFVG